MNGVCHFIDLGREGEKFVGTGNISRGNSSHASSMGVFQHIFRELHFSRAVHFTSYVRTAQQEIPSLTGVVCDSLAQRGAECFLFGSHNQVYNGIFIHTYESVFYCFIATRDKRMITCRLNGFPVNEWIVEGVSGHQCSFQLIATITQSIRGFLSYACLVKTYLCTTIGRSMKVGHPWILMHGKSLMSWCIERFRSAGTVECIDNKYGALVVLGMTGR